jgi:signal peptidase I
VGIFDRLFQKKQKQAPVKERTPLTIEVGDIVTYDLTEYEVVGKIIYRDHGYEWLGYQLLEGNDFIWLSAEMDDELELGIYKTVNIPVTIPFPKQLAYQDKTYHLDEEGEARVIGEGRSKNVNDQTIKYADYCDSDEEHFLSVESWGSEVEVSYGYPIEAYEIKIIAGANELEEEI